MSEPDDRLVQRVVAAAGGRDAAEACPDAEVLGLYAERQLDGVERVGVETHVADCARCQATLAVFVRSAPAGGEVAGAGVRADAGEAPATWWSGWKWLVPVAATAAVVTIAVWVQRPAAPGAALVQGEKAADAMAMREANQGEPAASAEAAAGAPAPAASETAAGRRAQSRAEARPSAPAVPAASPSALADAGGQTAPAAATRPSPATTLAEARQEAVAVPAPPEARAKALSSAAGARPADAVADARERSVPAVPAPAAPAVTAADAREIETFSRRQADSREANRADAAAPAQAKAAAGQESAARVGGTAAAAAPARRPAQLTGRVTYRTRAALPEGAIIDVRLLDVSRADAPATMLGRVEIVTRGEQVPVPFTIGYDAAAIDPRFRYTVQVTITVGADVAYRTTTAHPVLTNGAPAANVEVVVEPMR